MSKHRKRGRKRPFIIGSMGESEMKDWIESLRDSIVERRFLHEGILLNTLWNGLTVKLHSLHQAADREKWSDGFGVLGTLLPLEIRTRRVPAIATSLA